MAQRGSPVAKQSLYALAAISGSLHFYLILFYYFIRFCSPGFWISQNVFQLPSHSKGEFGGRKILGDQVIPQNAILVLHCLENCSNINSRKGKTQCIAGSQGFSCPEAGGGSFPSRSFSLSLLVPGMCWACLLCKLGSGFGSEDFPSVWPLCPFLFRPFCFPFVILPTNDGLYSPPPPHPHPLPSCPCFSALSLWLTSPQDLDPFPLCCPKQISPGAHASCGWWV